MSDLTDPFFPKVDLSAYHQEVRMPDTEIPWEGDLDMELMRNEDIVDDLMAFAEDLEDPFNGLTVERLNEIRNDIYEHNVHLRPAMDAQRALSRTHARWRDTLDGIDAYHEARNADMQPVVRRRRIRRNRR